MDEIKEIELKLSQYRELILKQTCKTEIANLERLIKEYQNKLVKLNKDL